MERRGFLKVLASAVGVAAVAKALPKTTEVAPLVVDTRTAVQTLTPPLPYGQTYAIDNQGNMYSWRSSQHQPIILGGRKWQNIV